MKTKLLPLLLLLLVLGLCACESGAPASGTVDMSQLQTALLEADDTLPEMQSVHGGMENADHSFSYISTMDYSKIENYLTSFSTTGKAEEITVIAVKDPADIKEAETALQDHLEYRKKIFQQYAPAEAKRLDLAQIFTQDQYAVLIITEKGDAVRDAFEAFVA